LFILAASLPKDVSAAGQGAQLTPRLNRFFHAGAASLKSGDFQGAITAFQKFLGSNKHLVQLT